MAKSRAQRKAEQRRREAERARKGDGVESDVEAQHETQVPESADVAEAELAERGADLDALTERPQESAPKRRFGRSPATPSSAEATDIAAEADAAPAEADAEPADRISRRAQKQAERDRKQRAKESATRRAPKDAPKPERQRGGVIGFFASCIAELRRVQWPDRETLIQASAITLIFIAVMAAYLGVLDAVFNFLIQRIL